jgi:hypothetical protein
MASPRLRWLTGASRHRRTADDGRLGTAATCWGQTAGGGAGLGGRGGGRGGARLGATALGAGTARGGSARGRRG